MSVIQTDADLTAEDNRLRRAWISVAIMTVILTLAYADRSALAVAAPEVRRDFGLSAVEFGALSSAFAWPYAISLLLVGGVIDRWGERRLFALGTILFSVAQLANGVVSSLWQFFVFRVVLGVGEAPGFMAAARATKMWFKDEEQGLPTGIWNCSSSLGPALAPLLFTPLVLVLGWRGMFMTIGAVGLVFSAIWYWYYRESPISHGSASPHDKSSGLIKNDITVRQWLGLFRHRSPLFLAIGAFFMGYLNFTLISWLPQYFELGRNISVAATGVLASLPFFAGVAGAIFGGTFADTMTERGLSRITSCKLGAAGGALLQAVCIIPALLVSNLVLSVVFFSLSQFFHSVSSSNAWTTVEAVSPPSRVGSVGSIWDFGLFIGSGIGPFVTGVLFQKTGGFLVPLMMASVGVLLSAGAYWFGVKNEVEA
jgi:sugar phosphate permease